MDNKGVVIHARLADLRHIWINCRCGQRSESEIPIQVAKARNIHVCPKCGVLYAIQLRTDGNTEGKRKEKWQIERMDQNVRDTTIMDS